jgi:hypothetical protein
MKQETIQVLESVDPADHPDLAVLYDAEGGLEIECWASASFASSDYGVKGSPVWDEVDDISIDEVAVNGHGYTWSEVREALGETIALRLADLCVEKANAYDWS